MGIDLGASTTTIYLNNDRFAALKEPTRVLVRAENVQDILAVGQEAAAMTGKTGDSTAILYPVRHGSVADIDMAALMMVALAEKATGHKKPMEKVTLVTSLAGNASRVEQAALFAAMEATTAKRIAAVRAPIAAAMGAGIDISKPHAVLMLTIGGSITEVTVISLYGIVAQRTLYLGGNDFDEAIVNYFIREKHLFISMRTAEQLKRDIGNVGTTDADEMPVVVKGRDVYTDRPGQVQITGRDMRAALEYPVRQLIDSLRSAVLNIPPELSADIRSGGIQLSGGGCLLRGLDERLKQETGLPVHISLNPLDDTALGLAMAAGSDKLLSMLIRSGSAETSAI